MADEFSELYLQRFAGVARLYGRDGLRRLAGAHVLVVGLGGVGSWVVEALARSGVGVLTLVDMDDVCVSNTNRQLQATTTDHGRPKAAVLRDRVLTINPECRVNAVERFFTKTTAEEILTPAGGLPAFSAVADAIDALSNKCLLIAECRRRKLPVVVSGGCAGKRDGTAVRVCDLSRSENDYLLKFVRKKLRNDYGFPRGGKRAAKFGIPCVWSPEFSTGVTECAAGDAPAGDAPAECAAGTAPAAFALPGTIAAGDDLRPNCEWGYGTAAHVAGAFGLALAGEIIRILTVTPRLPAAIF